MAYEKLEEQPALRSDMLPFGARGPGLYDDEVAVKIDGTHLVAVSVERHWQSNGSGIAFHGYARWIDEDGTTHLAPNGSEVEASISFTADTITLAAYSEDDIATEIALIVLGEETKLMRDLEQEDGSIIQVPVLALTSESKLNASIKHQVKAVQATKSKFIGL